MIRPGLGQSLLDRVARPLGLFDPEEIKQAMLAVSKDAFMACDEKLRIIEWAGAAEQILGWHRDEIVGLDFLETLVPEQERRRQERRIQDLLARDPPAQSEYRVATVVVTRDGHRTVEQTLGIARVRRKLVLVAFMRLI